MNDIQIKKLRTEGTADMILEIVKHLDLTSLVSNIYVQTDNPIAKDLIKRYEFKLIEAFEDKESFNKTLHSFYTETASYIKKNNLYKEFYSFCYFIFSSLSVKKRNDNNNNRLEGALNCYYNILLQQMNYFVPHPKMAYGLDSKGKLMTTNEAFPYLDVILMESYHNKNKNVSAEQIFKKYQKLGYDIHSEFDFTRYQKNDHLITNMVLEMSPLINENTLNIFSKNYFMLAEGIRLPHVKTDTAFFRRLLLEKHYFLPINGVIAKYENFQDIKEIYFQEIFTENRIILLYKVTATNGKDFYGYYDNKLELFYSVWEATDFGGAFHIRLENLILETYAYLVTDIENKVKEEETAFVKRLYLKEEVPVVSTKPLPTVEFLYEIKEKSETRGKKSNKKEDVKLRNFDKKKYKPSKVTIHPFVRRLPVGANASEEAIALAKEYHYVLREGETFVRPFERKTYRKED